MCLPNSVIFCCCPLDRLPVIGIKIDLLSYEPTWKKVAYLIVFSIMNIVLVPIRGLIHLLLLPIILLSVLVNYKEWANIFYVSLFILFKTILIIPIIGHIIMNIIGVKLISNYKKQESYLDCIVWHTLYPHFHMVDSTQAYICVDED